MTDACDADPSADLGLPRAGLGREEADLRHLYDSYRKLRWLLAEQLALRLEHDGGASLLERLPELASDPDLLAEARAYRAGATRASSPTSSLVRELGVPRELAHDGLFATRVGQLLVLFATAFVELRDGVRSFQASIDVQLASPPEQAQSATALLAYLLEPEQYPRRHQELREGFVLLMRHQLALLHALEAGARDLLGELTAQRRGGSLPARLRSLLRAFAQRGRSDSKLRALNEEGPLAKLLLGRAFRRAYVASVADAGEAE